MDAIQPNPTSIIDIFSVVEEIVYDSSNKNDIYVPISITTEDGFVNTVVISNSKEDNFSINKNIILYKNKAINLNKIVKIKILTDNINLNKFKDLLSRRLRNLANYNYNDQISFSRKRRVQNFNTFTNDFSRNDNLQDYIIKNMENIKTINYNKPSGSYISPNLSKEDILNSSTNLYVNKKEVLEDVNLDTDKLDVVSFIEKNTQNVLTEIETEEKLVLTNNSEEVEVSKPIYTEDINVLTNLEIKDYPISTSQIPAQAIGDISQNKIEAITNINPQYLENTISNIDIQRQIIPPKTVEVLDLAPVNRFINKHELDGRLLRLDPTGENYIGVFLDDGTFEPLRLTFKTFSVIPEDTINIVGNIYRSHLKNSLSDMDISKDTLIKSLDIDYNNDLVKYQSENMLPLSDFIIQHKSIIKNITNETETASVVSKNSYETINSIKNVKHSTIENISDIKMSPVVNSTELVKSNHQVIENINLDKNTSSVVKDIDLNNKDINSLKSEDINGAIEFTGNGLMVVSDNDSDIVIYSIPKINSVN
ncbi:hypothetical protein ACQQ2T_10675 [Paraclostridium tenue]